MRSVGVKPERSSIPVLQLELFKKEDGYLKCLSFLKAPFACALTSDSWGAYVLLIVVSGGCKILKWPQITIFPWFFLSPKNTRDKEEKGVVKSKDPQIPVVLTVPHRSVEIVLEHTTKNTHGTFGVISCMQ
ncbi:hypothetical protein EDB84DRAFT_1432941 [Lactarius hengduanensis]|nr:hypothetical protein EDB84DRAFT_1432941 [Lactarius hengduanensis]